MKELLEKIGTQAMLEMSGLKIRVKITNVRKAYGRIDFQVQPIAGVGMIWVSHERLIEAV